MKIMLRMLLNVSVAAVIWTSGVSKLAGQNTDTHWVTPFSLPGVGGGGGVYAIATTPTNLYVGGTFNANNGNSGVGNYVARWDATGWSSLGAGIDTSADALVSAIAVVGSDVYVTGTFNSASGVAATNIARWDGAQWHALGSGVVGQGSFGQGVVRAIATDGANIYVGGNFTSAGGVRATNIAKWDGTQWLALGAGLDGPVNALAYANGVLYVGGTFTHAGSVQAVEVARWNGNSWSDLGVGVHGGFGVVSALAVDGPNVYVGGQFLNAGGTNNVFGGLSGGLDVANLARWDGQQWSALGGGINGAVSSPFGSSPPLVATLAVQNGSLFVGGLFTQAGSVGATNIARWDGTTWSALGNGIINNSTSFSTPIVNALSVQGNSLFMGGAFSDVDGVTTGLAGGIGGLARWDGSAWSAVGLGFSGLFPSPAFSVQTSVDAIVMTGSTWYVGGNFTNAGGISANGIVSGGLNGWTPLGSGLDNRVRAVAQGGGSVYAGGDFAHAGGRPASHIAAWNGTTWAALGNGVDGTVDALAANASDVYAGGSFTTAGGVTVNHIAHWDGTTWSALGAGLNGTVYVLVLSGTDLYAGGQFSLAGSVAVNSVAKWDGTQWSGLGNGLRVSDSVGASAATVYGLSFAPGSGQLYAVGLFLLAGETNANYVAQWDGSVWSPLGSGIASSSFSGPSVFSVVATGSDVYVGGAFDSAGGTSVHNITRWDGSKWNALGSGAVQVGFGGFVGGSVNALAAATGTASPATIAVGGLFSAAGGRPSANFALWQGASVAAVPRLDFALSANTLTISWSAAGGVVLESTDDLAAKPVQWTLVPTDPGATSATVQATSTSRFYRLRQP
ncbi:MAG: beta strand repeat-containing protein [Limisphaerales bacterium]